jgi:3-hydroxyacyl-CoA dehydrogenase
VAEVARGGRGGAGGVAGGGDRPLTDEEIRDRCLYLMVNEAAYALDDEVVSDPDMVDLAMIMGTGFPPFRGGLLRWADDVGVSTIRDRLAELAETLGSRFTPAPRLERMADQDRTFTHSSETALP